MDSETPFVLPTIADEQNLALYIQERKTLYQYNVLHDHLKNISSTLILEIRAATQANYKFPAKFRDHAVLCQARMSQRSCELSNCNIVYPRGKVCTGTSEPRLFKSGHSTLLACEPACFNLFENAPKKSPLSVPMFYYEPYQACVITDSAYKAAMIDDYNRTNNHTTVNVDTIGTGFDEAPEPYLDSEGNVAPKYLINQFYCDALHLDLERNEKFNECVDSTGRKVAGYTIGSYMYSLFAYGGDYFKYGLTVKDVRQPATGSIDYTKYPSYLMDLDLWSNYRGHAKKIDVNVKLSDLGITAATRHMTWTNEFSAEGNLVEPLLVYTTVTLDGFDNGPNSQTNANGSTDGGGRGQPFKQINYTQYKNYITAKVCPPQFRIEDTGFKQKPKLPMINLSGFNPTLPNWFENMLDHIFSSDFLQNIIITNNIARSLGYLKAFMARVAKNLLPNFLEMLQSMITRHIVYISVIRPSLSITIAFAVTSLISKALIVVLNILGAVVDIVQIAFVVSMILDMVFTHYDWLNINKRLGSVQMKRYADDGMANNFKNFGMRSPPFDVELLFNMFLAFHGPPPDQTEPSGDAPAAQPTSGRRRKRQANAAGATGATAPSTAGLDKTQIDQMIKERPLLAGVRDGATVEPKAALPPPESEPHLRQKVLDDLQVLTILWSADFFTSHEYNSDGSIYDWDNKSAVNKVHRDDVVKMLNDTISDEFIDTKIFTSDLDERMHGADKIKTGIKVCLLGTMGGVMFQSTLGVVIMTVLLVALIAWHNFYIVYDERFDQIQQYDNLFKRELLKVV